MSRARTPAVTARRAQREIARRVDALMTEASRRHDAGDVRGAIRGYRAAIALAPGYGPAHYDLALVYKYARRWHESLRANLAALRIDPRHPGAIWNAAIAATALREWKTARAMWKRYGIDVPRGAGEICGAFGTAVVRLNPEGEGETVWARRVCPARVVLMNIPLPESGYRLGDLVLHDGAPQGSRRRGGREYPVFNALQLVKRAETRTYAVELRVPAEGDLRALCDEAARRKIEVEDWSSMAMLCLKCSYGVRHRHRKPARPRGWSVQRSVGIASRTRQPVEALLERWRKAGPGREVGRIYGRKPPQGATRARNAWWNYESFSEDNG